MLQPFSLLIKPVGGACNLACRYCFYLGHVPGVIAPETLARALDTYCALPFAQKAVALQGGEPLLAPPRVLDAVEAHPVARSLQTNGTLLTPALAERLAARNWLVGVSVDGPPELHDALRGAGSFAAAERGIRHLERARADYNLLSVVTPAAARTPAATYRFLRDTFQTRFHQYIECTGPNPEHALTGDEWGAFLCGLFDEWIRSDANTVSVRLFESLASFLARGYPTQCSFARTCRQYLVVEHDGSVYPCDFHVRPDLRLGNVMTHTWEELLSSPVYARFASAKETNLPARCRACEWLAVCRGDCPRSRQTLCPGWRRFFPHALPRIAELLADSDNG